LRTLATRAIWRPAGNPARPAADCTTAVPFLATIRERAGPFTLLLMAACIIVFIIMNVVGDQSVMIAGWPYDPSLEFDVWRYFSHALMHFSVMHILLTCSGGGISAVPLKSVWAAAS
jgi:membrane associated rhomboid family serine protease